MSSSCFAGVDWASEEHACCVVDEDGRIIEGRRYRHDERGITAPCRQLGDLGVELVAIERPDGLLIERLLDVAPGSASTEAALERLAAHASRTYNAPPTSTSGA